MSPTGPLNPAADMAALPAPQPAQHAAPDNLDLMIGMRRRRRIRHSAWRSR